MRKTCSPHRSWDGTWRGHEQERAKTPAAKWSLAWSFSAPHQGQLLWPPEKSPKGSGSHHLKFHLGPEIQWCRMTSWNHHLSRSSTFHGSRWQNRKRGICDTCKASYDTKCRPAPVSAAHSSPPMAWDGVTMWLSAAAMATAAATFGVAGLGLAFESAFESLGFAGGVLTWL